MLFKRIVLFFLSILLILIFFKTEVYHGWFEKKINEPLARLEEQREHMSEEERKEMRYGLSYFVSRAADSLLNLQGVKDAEILFTPNSYIRANIKKTDSTDFLSPDPSVFYYFTGRKALWTNSPGVDRASWAILVAKEPSVFVNFLPQSSHSSVLYVIYNVRELCIILIQIKNKDELQHILSFYKNYKAVL